MKKTIVYISLMILSLTVYAQQPKEEKASIKVYGNCGMCKKTIESALKVDGVSAAIWNPDTKILKVKYNPAVISLDSIQKLITSKGYDTQDYKADDAVYESLHKCCKYERKK